MTYRLEICKVVNVFTEDILAKSYIYAFILQGFKRVKAFFGNGSYMKAVYQLRKIRRQITYNYFPKLRRLL